MRVRVAVAIMTVLLLLYVVLAGQRALVLLTSAEPVAIAMGVALLVMPLLALWATGRELWFGVRAQQLGDRLDAEGGLPDDDLPVRPSGRIEREDGDALFPKYRADVEAHPDDWRARYRLALAYDAAGDRRRARSAVRTAVRLEGAERRAG
ncbi:hypothetical protein [Microbacterium enclense]|uniref:hypothetical protein n=1 Tax=Microbacterium enclense TaxID=993073 RepID=UPI0034250FB8